MRGSRPGTAGSAGRCRRSRQTPRRAPREARPARAEIARRALGEEAAFAPFSGSVVGTVAALRRCRSPRRRPGSWSPVRCRRMRRRGRRERRRRRERSHERARASAGASGETRAMTAPSDAREDWRHTARIERLLASVLSPASQRSPTMSAGALPPVFIVSATRTPIGAYLGSLSCAHRAAARRDRHQGGARAREGRAGARSARSSWATCSPPASARRPRVRRCASRASPTASRRRPSARSAARACRRSSSARRRSRSATRDIVVAGGMESMSNVPYYLRQGAPGLPHGQRHAHRRHDPRRPLGSVRERPHGQRAATSAPPSTRSRARRRTSSRRRASAARSPRRRKASSTPRSRPSPSRSARATRSW